MRGVGATTKARLDAAGVVTVGDIIDADEAKQNELARQGLPRRTFERLKQQAEQIIAGDLPDPLRVDPCVCPMCGEEYKQKDYLKQHMERDNRCFMCLQKPFVPRRRGSSYNDIGLAGRHFNFVTKDGKRAAGYFPGNDATVIVWCAESTYAVHTGDWRDLIAKPIEWVMN